MNKSLRAKLGVAFGTIFLILVAATLYNLYYLSKISDIQHRVIDLRLKTVTAGKDMNNGINYSLAALRGYMILGDNADKATAMKKQRNEAWAQIKRSLDTFDSVSEHWTVASNITIYNNLKKELGEFKVAQQQVEDIAQRTENIASYQLLLDEAAPRASQILSAITNIINIEASLPATDDRKMLLKLLADSRGSFAIGLASIRAYLLSGKAEFKSNFNNKWAINQQSFNAIEQNYRYLFNQDQATQWQTYSKVRGEFSALPAQMFTLRGATDWNKANYILATEAAPHAKAALAYLHQMQRSQEKLLDGDIAALQNALTMQQLILALGAIASLVMSVLIAMWFSKDLLSRLDPILEKAQGIANSDLSTPMLEVKGKDELATLTVAVNAMSQSLSETLTTTADSMQGVSSQASDICNANANMSLNIADQVDQISLIASATEELSASANEVSGQSRLAAVSAQESLDSAQRGGQLVADSLQQMTIISETFNDSAKSINSLSEQSKQIEDILGVIRGIAEQTNLLALNAAIEAARAGEQGRGFAVVADEVRQLASRTTDATSDVEQAIDAMRNDTKIAVLSMVQGREKVEDGIKINNQVSDILNEIIDRAQDVSVKIETIATTAQQQYEVSNEIAGNTDNVSNASRIVSDNISKVLEMSQDVLQSSSRKANELNLMVNR
ncbi:MAG: methyl-accepting chemotaxis protein [Psychrobium sp.]|nr:methyl-accepting chemotaxis protein [Psychrobium sp.]